MLIYDEQHYGAPINHCTLKSIIIFSLLKVCEHIILNELMSAVISLMKKSTQSPSPVPVVRYIQH